MITTRDLETIEKMLKELSEKGFGEMRIVVLNGYVHRIIKSEDYLVEKQATVKL